VFAFTGTGFGRLAAEAGALQSELPAKANVLAKASTSASKVLGKDLGSWDTFIVG
jgi:hypothetical protein